MTDDTMNTLRFIEIILRALEDIIFPAIALWAVYLVRKWIAGELPVPPHIHQVTLQQPTATTAGSLYDEARNHAGRGA